MNFVSRVDYLCEVKKSGFMDFLDELGLQG